MTHNHGYVYRERVDPTSGATTVLEYLSHRFRHTTREEWVARIQSEINRLFENLLDLNNPAGETGWSPNVDILETQYRV